MCKLVNFKLTVTFENHTSFHSEFMHSFELFVCNMRNNRVSEVHIVLTLIVRQKNVLFLGANLKNIPVLRHNESLIYTDSSILHVSEQLVLHTELVNQNTVFPLYTPKLLKNFESLMTLFNEYVFGVLGEPHSRLFGEMGKKFV